MINRLIAVAALAVCTSASAHAGLTFDTVTGATPFAVSGSNSDGSGIMAQSFALAGSPDFNSISFVLSADDPTDGGSVLVLLVPDDGSGNALGVAGAPDFVNAVQVGSIDDSILSDNLSGTTTVTLTGILNPLGAITLNNEYWISLVPVASSVEWYANANTIGSVNTDGQTAFNDVYGATYAINGTSIQGPYELQVDAPEPATIAILGGGIVGLGYFRRRRLTKNG